MISKELNYIKKWLDVNRLATNVEKTNLFILHSTHNSLNGSVHIKIGNQRIQQVKFASFLGVLLNENRPVAMGWHGVANSTPEQ